MQENIRRKGVQGGFRCQNSSERKAIDILFKEAICFKERLDSNIEELEFEGLSDLRPEEQVEESSILESQWEYLLLCNEYLLW
jgi:hypothetical protein